MLNKKNINRINKQKEIEQRKRKKRIKLIFKIFMLMIFLLIITYLFTSDSFSITEIEIVGNKQLKQEQIYNLLNIKLGDNIFKKIGIVEEVRLKQNGYIEDVQISKIYPNKVKVEIKERVKKFQIYTQTGNYIYIDEQGYILESSTEKLELITITGMEYVENDNVTQKRLNEKDLEKMEKILHIIAGIESINNIETISQIETEKDIIVHLQDDKFVINFGDATDINNKMLYVKAIIEQEQGNSGTIFVNGNLNEGFKPYFKTN